MVIAALGTVLAAGYLLWLSSGWLRHAHRGVRKRAHHDVHLTDYIAWTPMIIFIVVLGVYPNLFLMGITNPVVHSHRHSVRRELIMCSLRSSPGVPTSSGLDIDWHALAPESCWRAGQRC
jgi:NADH:ubiquinone oxidoreductase subunit 4 (subunit M)